MQLQHTISLALLVAFLDVACSSAVSLSATDGANHFLRVVPGAESEVVPQGTIATKHADLFAALEEAKAGSTTAGAVTTTLPSTAGTTTADETEDREWEDYDGAISPGHIRFSLVDGERLRPPSGESEIWKHCLDPDRKWDIRRVYAFDDSTGFKGAAALKINKVQRRSSSGTMDVLLPSEEAEAIPMFEGTERPLAPMLKRMVSASSADGRIVDTTAGPPQFAGDRMQHEIAMYRFMVDFYGTLADDYLVPFLGGGVVWPVYAPAGGPPPEGVEAQGSADGAVPSLVVTQLRFLNQNNVLLFQSDCGTEADVGAGTAVYTFKECAEIAAWAPNDSSDHPTEAYWLLTGIEEGSMTVLEYLQALLAVQHDEVTRDMRLQELAAAIKACQNMLAKLHQYTGFVHTDYHLKNMLVVPPASSIIYTKTGKTAPEAALAHDSPRPLLFDLDYSGFLPHANLGKLPRVASNLVSEQTVLNVPMLHTIPLLDPGSKAAAQVGGKQQISFVQLLLNNELLNQTTHDLIMGMGSALDMWPINDAARQYLYHADRWLGVMQLLEFAFPCDETPLARELAGLDDSADPQREMFKKFVVTFWAPEAAGTDSVDAVVKALNKLDVIFGEQQIGEHEGQHDEEFKNAWFRVKMLTKAAVVDKWYAKRKINGDV